MRKKRNKIVILLSIIIVGIICIFFGYRLIRSYVMGKLNKTYTAKVETVFWGTDRLGLSTGKTVDLVGSYIPFKEEINFREEMARNFINLMKGKEIKIKTILKAVPDYPEYDLVEVYLEGGTLVNEKLLKEGMAFFDHGYYKGMDKYEKLQEEAKAKKIGIWREENRLKVIYIGSKKKQFFHYAECSKVNDIKDVDKLYYYFKPPFMVFHRTIDWGCSYCAEKYNATIRSKK